VSFTRELKQYTLQRKQELKNNYKHTTKNEKCSARILGWFTLQGVVHKRIQAIHTSRKQEIKTNNENRIYDKTQKQNTPSPRQRRQF
jgi:hypothetical protein